MLDIHLLMKQLSRERPIFHSEADFQHALAWALHGAFPDGSIRLEMPFVIAKNALHLDLLFVRAGSTIAIELKYKTRGLTVQIGPERFALADQSAQDLARYDLAKDIQRLERIVADRPAAKGWVIFLTNDSAYWKLPASRETIDASFRIHEAHNLEGRLAWAPGASAGTTKGREAPILLIGKYPMIWHDYSRPSPSSYGQFRYMALPIG
jgi:hypothetical protein